MPATSMDRHCSGKDTTVKMDQLKNSLEQHMNWKASVLKSLLICVVLVVIML